MEKKTSIRKRQSRLTSKGVAEKIKLSYEELQKTYSFKPGQLVKWKKGMQNRKYPKDDHPAVVIEVLHTPLVDEHADPGSAYFRESLDIILGIVNDAGLFGIFYFDKRRFEPFNVNERN